MFSETAELYDLIYLSFKDYVAEAAQVATLLRRVHPSCRTILDVACGTGEHARLLAENHGFLVDGLDLEPDFVRIAQRKHATGRFFQADMSDFHLPRRYDAITCLFSSIGYLKTLDRVSRAFQCFAKHLAADGVVLVEPWFEPGVLEHGHIAHRTGERNGVRVERVSHTEILERLSSLHFDYTITDANGVRHASEVHELGLFTHDELQETLRRAGLRVDHDPQGLIGRGLYVARIAS